MRMASCTHGAGARRWPLGIACWAGLLGFYEVLAGGPSWPEVAAGGLASFLATIAVFASGEPAHLGRMQWSWWWLLARRLPRQIWTDAARILGSALGPSSPSGRFRSVPFEPGGEDPVSGSRRALVTAGGSVAPNSYIVTIAAERSELLIHQLVDTEVPPGHGDRLWPI
jgi:hypothetical protein